MEHSDIPTELLHIILSYDGRIKYRNGKYVNIIHKNDKRYHIIEPIISKKIEILQDIELSETGFYFEFGFDTYKGIGLVYDYNFSYPNTFEICYYDTKRSGHILGSDQIRTIYD
jgi:hypothetical protein